MQDLQAGTKAYGRHKKVTGDNAVPGKLHRRRGRATVSGIVEDVLGCKWTLHILLKVRAGVRRPGALVRSANGLTTKVMNERLTKLVRFGVLQKMIYPEVPPRVEYELTPLGTQLNRVLDEIERIQQQLDAGRFRKGPSILK